VKPERFDNINLLRAWAALSVVVYHVIEHGGWSEFPRSGPLHAFRVGWLGVDLFFVISGFVIAYSALCLYRASAAGFAPQYWRRRLGRILPLYLLTLFAWIALAGTFRLPPADFAWQLFTHLGFIHSFWPDTHGAIDGPNWSLAIEMQFYLAIALAVRWIDRTPGWRIWLYGIAISWAWRACMFMLHGHEDAFHIFVAVTQLPGLLDEFGAGIFLAKLVLDGPPRRPWHGWAWLAGACMAGVLAMGIYWPHGSYWDIPAMVVFWRTALAVFFLAVVGSAVHLPQWLGLWALRPVNFLGEVSYGIYLWHLFAVVGVIHLGGYRRMEALAGVLVLTVLAASLSWRYLERPLMELARQGSARRPRYRLRAAPPVDGADSEGARSTPPSRT